MDDLEYDDIQDRLSTPAAAIPGQVPRRAFLQGALAAGAGAFLLPSWADHLAAAATPVGPQDGILVVLQLGGGNDGLSMVSPTASHPDHGRYQTARGNLAVGGALNLADGLGLHPSMPRLKSRWDKGEVAVVRGVGQPTIDLSHFTSTGTWMAGTSGPTRTTGWLGRWLDGVPEADQGLRATHIGSSIPLHLQGDRSVVTALGPGADLFGADRREAWMTPVYDGLTAMGNGTNGRGRLADLIADTGAISIATAQRLAPLYQPALAKDLGGDLTMAARLVNANLGIRVLSCAHGSYDLHYGLGYFYPRLLSEVDRAIEAFFAALDPAFRDRVTLMTFSEFGRTVNANGSGGADHGTSSPQLVIGAKVKGGLYGAQPRLNALTPRGDLKVHVDLRSYYASVVDGWLAGGSSAVLGGTYEDLHLFQSAPGTSPPPPPLPTPPQVLTGAWRPFPDPATLVRQQYIDFLGRPADQPGVYFWVGQLTTTGRSIAWVVNAFLASHEFGEAVAPAARLALSCLGRPDAYEDLIAWAARVRRREPLGPIAADAVTRPDFAARYGSLSEGDFVQQAHRDATGRSPSGSWATTWTTRLGNGTHTRADVMAAIVALPATADHLRVQVEVMMTYAGLLRRAPDPGGYEFWVAKGNAGASIQRLVQLFFASEEYQRRFA